MENRFYRNTSKIIDIIENSKKEANLELKRSEIYLDWLYRQIELYEIEKLPLSIPLNCIPNKITKYAYDKNEDDVKIVIDKYYVEIGEDYEQKISNFDAIDLNILLHKIVFIRGNVVWVEFGFNVGCEFGGKHPAVILKNLGEILIVAPLTSGKPNSPKKPAEVIINMVYGLPKRDRYTNITRITPISCYRVDLNSPVGSIHSKDLKEIFLTMKKEWGF